MKDNENIFEQIPLSTSLLLRLNQKNEDILAMSLLQPLLKDTFLPFTNMAIRPINLICIVNDIVLNQRTNILEFGSGISTILMARLVKQLGLRAKVISVEHDISWLNYIKSVIEKENLNDIIRLVHAPLNPLKGSDNNWYNLESLETDNITTLPFDLVIIDGPPAWEKDKEESRYYALPFILNCLTDNSVVYLDDADRQGERSIIKKWESRYDVRFKFFGTLAYFHKGKFYDPVLR